jgi:hypothetical protein
VWAVTELVAVVVLYCYGVVAVVVLAFSGGRGGGEDFTVVVALVV